MHRLLTVCLTLVCVIPATWGQRQGSRKEVFEWKVEEYPDPFSYDTFAKCGRSNKSNICDPSKLISVDQANKIDSLIWRVFQETRCGCNSCKQNSHGYVIRVAIMPRMVSIFNQGNSTEALLKNAQMFAYILTQKWAMSGSCNESVLILLSRYDGVVYTLTLPEAGRRLKNNAIKRITLAVRPMFDNDKTVGKGLYEMIERYRLIFEDNEDKALRPMVSAQRFNKATSISPSIFLPFLLIAFFMAVIH